MVSMKEPAVVSRFFAGFLDFKTCFRVGTTAILFSSSVPRAGVSENGNRWLYTYIPGLITGKEPMLSQRSTQHGSLNPPDRVPTQNW